MKTSYAAILFLSFLLPLKGTATIDFTVDDAVENALRYNYDIAQSSFQVERDYWSRWVSVAKWLPNASFDWSRNWTGGISNGVGTVNGDLINEIKTINITQLIYSQALLMEIASVGADYNASFWDYHENILLAVRDVRVAHYKIIQYMNLLDVEQENLDLLYQAYEDEKTLAEYGESTIFNSNRNELEYMSDLTNFYSFSRTLEISYADWVKLMGIDPMEFDQYHVVEKVPPIHSIPFIEELLTRVKNNNGQITRDLFSAAEIRSWQCLAAQVKPFLKGLAFKREASKYRVKSIQGEYIPTVNFDYQYSKWNTTGRPTVVGARIPGTPATLTPNVDNWSVAVQLQWKLFDGFSREARINRENANFKISESKESQGWDTVMLDIERAAAELQQSVYSYHAALESERLGEVGIAYAKEQFLLGDLSALEYRDMVRSKTRAGFDLVNAEFGMMSSYYTLLYAIGLFDDDQGCLLLEHNENLCKYVKSKTKR